MEYDALILKAVEVTEVFSITWLILLSVILIPVHL